MIEFEYQSLIYFLKNSNGTKSIYAHTYHSQCNNDQIIFVEKAEFMIILTIWRNVYNLI